jgi:hypothetical protein
MKSEKLITIFGNKKAAHYCTALRELPIEINQPQKLTSLGSLESCINQIENTQNDNFANDLKGCSQNYLAINV